MPTSKSRAILRKFLIPMRWQWNADRGVWEPINCETGKPLEGLQVGFISGAIRSAPSLSKI